jgi:hypothetical protein
MKTCPDCEHLRSEVRHLLDILASKRLIDAGQNTGMGSNITIEHAARLPSQIRRVRKLLDPLPAPPERPTHG